MKTKKHFFLKSKIFSVAASTLFVLTACTEDKELVEINQGQISDVKNQSLTNRTTFNWVPQKPRTVQDIPGLNVKKRLIADEAYRISNHNNNFASFALAIAMQETQTLTGNTGNENNGSEYPWRDSKSADVNNSLHKRGDSSCFGIYKMNWFMIRISATMKEKNNGNILGEYAYGTFYNNGYGKQINNNITLATEILYDYWNTLNSRPKGTSADGNSSDNDKIGIKNNFWGGHRYGRTGWDSYNPQGTVGRNDNGWQDTINYWYSVLQTKQEIDGQLQNFKTTNRRIAHAIHNI